MNNRLINTGSAALPSAPLQFYLNTNSPGFSAVPIYFRVYYDDSGSWVLFSEHYQSSGSITTTIEAPIGIPLRIEVAVVDSPYCDTRSATVYKSYGGFSASSITAGDFTNSTNLEWSEYVCKNHGSFTFRYTYFTWS